MNCVCAIRALPEVEEVGQHFVGQKVTKRTLFHVVPHDLKKLQKMALHQQLLDAGVEIHAHCPLAGLTVRLNPKNRQVLTTSGKLHYYLEGAEYGTLEDALELAGVAVDTTS